jgi:flagellar biosynthesis protein FliP
MNSNAGVHWVLQFKLIFFVPVGGWSLVAGSLEQSCAE